jgi:hypothetical protein
LSYFLHQTRIPEAFFLCHIPPPFVSIHCLMNLCIGSDALVDVYSKFINTNYKVYHIVW